MNDREKRARSRALGQFWTPDWIARVMAEYVLADRSDVAFDPAVGSGALLLAVKTVARERGLNVRLAGMEIDPVVATRARIALQDAHAAIAIGDFVKHPPTETYPAIIANPPYLRYHRLDAEAKAALRHDAARIMGVALNGRAGLHVFFLIRALSLLAPHGRLAILLPSDAFEGSFAAQVWTWITRRFALDAVLTFLPDASPFPGLDINPVLTFIRNAPPQSQFLWSECRRPATAALAQWVRSGFAAVPDQEMTVVLRDVQEGAATGLSRRPFPVSAATYALGDFVRVMRGVVTGANDFFTLTAAEAKRRWIPDEALALTIEKTRDAPGTSITAATLERLERMGRPTRLLMLREDDEATWPEPVRQYLQEGERLGIPQRPVVAQRHPWYKMETREAPPFVFAYLGRRNVRFLRNEARVIPLSSFLCVYPRWSEADAEDRIWRLLSDPAVQENLARVGKTYGNGAIKVEPRALERTPVPDHLIERYGFPLQMRLC